MDSYWKKNSSWATYNDLTAALRTISETLRGRFIISVRLQFSLLCVFFRNLRIVICYGDAVVEHGVGCGSSSDSPMILLWRSHNARTALVPVSSLLVSHPGKLCSPTMNHYQLARLSTPPMCCSTLPWCAGLRIRPGLWRHLESVWWRWEPLPADSVRSKTDRP